MPVQLPQAAGLQRHKRGRDGRGDREVGRVNLVEGAAIAGHGLRRVLQGVVHPGAIARGGAGGTVRHVVGANGAVEDGRVGLGDVGEGGRRDVEVFGQNVGRSVANPVIKVEGDPALC